VLQRKVPAPDFSEIGPPAKNGFTRKNEDARPLFDLTGLRSELKPRRCCDNVIRLFCPICQQARAQLLCTRRGRLMCATCSRRFV
jgi:hypothetical protein